MLTLITAGMVVPVQNPTVMGHFEPAVKFYSDVLDTRGQSLHIQCSEILVKQKIGLANNNSSESLKIM